MARKKETTPAVAEGCAIESTPIGTRFKRGDSVRHALTGKKATYVDSERAGWNTVKTSTGLANWTDACTEPDTTEVPE